MNITQKTREIGDPVNDGGPFKYRRFRDAEKRLQPFLRHHLAVGIQLSSENAAVCTEGTEAALTGRVNQGTAGNIDFVEDLPINDVDDGDGGRRVKVEHKQQFFVVD